MTEITYANLNYFDVHQAAIASCELKEDLNPTIAIDYTKRLHNLQDKFLRKRTIAIVAIVAISIIAVAVLTLCCLYTLPLLPFAGMICASIIASAALTLSSTLFADAKRHKRAADRQLKMMNELHAKYYNTTERRLKSKYFKITGQQLSPEVEKELATIDPQMPIRVLAPILYKYKKLSHKLNCLSRDIEDIPNTTVPKYEQLVGLSSDQAATNAMQPIEDELEHYGTQFLHLNLSFAQTLAKMAFTIEILKAPFHRDLHSPKKLYYVLNLSDDARIASTRLNSSIPWDFMIIYQRRSETFTGDLIPTNYKEFLLKHLTEGHKVTVVEQSTGEERQLTLDDIQNIPSEEIQSRPNKVTIRYENRVSLNDVEVLNKLTPIELGRYMTPRQA